MNNSSNRKIYKTWARVYDKLFGSRYFNSQRKLELSMLNIKNGDKVLLVGVGTGEDLRFIPRNAKITAVDITDKMLHIAKSKAEELGFIDYDILNMDGENLEFEDNSFDFVVLNLILSVIPDGNKCLKEAYRVLKKNGKIGIFDKFIEDHSKPNLFRRLFNKITKILGTDINRRFSDILGNIKLRIIDEKKSILGGAYVIIILQK